jgi:hypothetical protein
MKFANFAAITEILTTQRRVETPKWVGTFTKSSNYENE